jgi:DNA repair protein RadD
MIQPRPYQQEAHDKVIEHWKGSTLPCLVEAATGAGKSVIVAMLAHTLHTLSKGKRVLCLAPSAELIHQNAEKYQLIGERCSIYSASAGTKSLRHQVVFATEGTFKTQAKKLGPDFAGVIVDECHRLTPTIKQIIEDMRAGNPNLRVCGLSATPYRLGDGFIFGIDPDGRALPAEVARDPYFHQCVYSIGARMLLSMGYLTPLRAADINAESYDTSGLKVQANGKFSDASLKAAFEGWGRKTSAIIADVAAQTQNATGVMIFAATVQHAKEVMASLHPDNARCIVGDTAKAERKQIIEDFKARKFLYLVSVGTLTTGFDAGHVSHIAILRATESVSLLQQIMGRGMRLFDGKAECVVLDYAGNIDKHMPDGDLYAPQIKAAYQSSGGGIIECLCEDCGRVNLFSARPNDHEYQIDQHGYFADLDGNRITVQDHKGEQVPMPAHYGRRCQHVNTRTGERCGYFWSCKVCPVCEHVNDIAARFCGSCKAELVNPNDKLLEFFTAHKKDPTQPQTDLVVSIDYVRGISRSGNDMITANIVTTRRKFSVYLLENSTYAASKKAAFAQGTSEFTRVPRTISYVKDGDFWKVLGFDRPSDEEVLQARLAA